MSYENYTIKQFEAALFRNDRTVMSEEEFDTVRMEYIDTAGLYETEEFEKKKYIQYLLNRVNSVKLAIQTHLLFLEEFGIPFVEELKFFKKFGHKVTWKENDYAGFREQLRRVQSMENKYVSQLENEVKKLKDLQEKKSKKQVVAVEQTVGSWTRTINSLRKIGWHINKETDTVMELAYIIKQQTESNNEERNTKR